MASKATKTKARPKTPNRGAADLAASLKAYLRRKMSRTDNPQAYYALDEVYAWISDWDARATKKTGGLGRK